jgi:hypothetical protein
MSGGGVRLPRESTEKEVVISTATLQAKLFRTGIALSEEVRIQMVDLLNSILADACDLHSHLRHAH